MNNEKQVIIKNTGTRIINAYQIKGAATLASFTFMTGNNFIDAKLYNAVKKDLDLHFKEGILEVLHLDEADKGKGDVSVDFKELDMEDAEIVIKQTYDEKTLEILKKGESRDSVRAAIADQIDNLTKYARKAKEQREKK